MQSPAQPDNPTQRPLSARASLKFEFLRPFFLFFAFFRSGTRWHLFVRLPGPRDWFSTTALLLFLLLPRMSCGRIRVITQSSFETCSPLSLGIIRGRNGNLRIHILPWAKCHWATQVPILDMTGEQLVRHKWLDWTTLGLNQEHSTQDQKYVCGSTYCRVCPGRFATGLPAHACPFGAYWDLRQGDS